jgi:hypothetical protein
MKFMKAHGLDKYVDAYAIHCWHYYKAGQKKPVFRDGKLQPIGKAALEP